MVITENIPQYRKIKEILEKAKEKTEKNRQKG